MWLLDHNLPVKLLKILDSFGIQCDSTSARGWRTLSNGQLASAAHQAGFRCILTKDTEFADAASKALKNLPDLAIVVIRLRQVKEAPYLESFKKEWARRAIIPTNGKVITWP